VILTGIINHKWQNGLLTLVRGSFIYHERIYGVPNQWLLGCAFCITLFIRFCNRVL